MTPLLLGLDPSTVWLGWALADLETGEPIACSREPVTGLARAIRHALREVSDTAARNDGDVCLIYIETAHVGPNPRSAIKVAEACGQVLQAANRRWPDAQIERLEPKEWRNLVDLSGNAPKAACATRAVELGWKPGSQDAADAACIATAGHHMNQHILERAGAA